MYSRARSRTRSPTPRSAGSRSPVRRGRYRDSRSPSRSPSPRGNGHGRGWDSRDRSRSPPQGGTKIVVERLTKNVNEEHIREIFGHFGPIVDLDLPMNRAFGTNRGTAYILYENRTDAEIALANMHESQVDGAIINVSIVLPRRLMSPDPPLARRGLFDPDRRASHNTGSGSYHDVGRGPRANLYRPSSRSRSPSWAPRDGGRYRSRSFDGYRSRSRSKSPRRDDGRYNGEPRRRSLSRRSLSRERSLSPRRNNYH
ncbi:hypothetical protein RJ55_01730 [Drechmeria coniospora]|nr:hypothetical protein RJ55_01730 [Drechmeria coniospora]